MRCLDEPLAIGAEITDPQIVGHDEDDVRLTERRRRRQEARERASAEEFNRLQRTPGTLKPSKTAHARASTSDSCAASVIVWLKAAAWAAIRPWLRIS